MGFFEFGTEQDSEFRVVSGNFLRLLGSGAVAAAEGVRGAEAQEGLAGCAAVHSESATRARGAGSVVDLFLSRSSGSSSVVTQPATRPPASSCTSGHRLQFPFKVYFQMILVPFYLF